MYPMMSYLQIKARAGLHKMFKEERGASGTIEAVILIGAVIVMAFVFRNGILDLMKNLWSSLIKDAAEGGGNSLGTATVNDLKIPQS